MKKALTGTACVAVLLTIVYVYFPQPAGAQQGALQVKDQACGVLDGDGHVALGADSMTVVSGGGMTMFKCSVKGVSNSQGKTVHWDHANTSMMCGTLGGPTNDWHETVSASGNATLTCRTKNNQN